MGIEHLVSQNSEMNQLVIQTIFIPLFSHPIGKILEEAFLLIRDPNSESLSSIYERLEDPALPEFFPNSSTIYFQNFDKEFNVGDNDYTNPKPFNTYHTPK